MFKILYMANTGDMFGGGQVSLLNLVKGLDRAKFEPFVVCPFEGSLVEAFGGIGLQPSIIRMPPLRNFNIPVFMVTVTRLVKFIKSNKMDLVHSNGSRAALYGGVAAGLAGVPFICHVRIPHSDGWIDRLLALLSRKIVVVSQAVAKRFAWLPENKKEIVYNGVDTKAFAYNAKRATQRTRFNLSEEAPVIGVVGRLSPEKGHTVLIDSLPEVIRTFPNVRVLIVGEGDDQLKASLHKKIGELNLTEHFVFAGFCEDVHNILGSIDILCLPSLTEGFNRSILEAMACGIPVIATNVGGNIESVRDRVNGLLVPPSNPSALAAAIVALLEDEATAQKMGQEGRRIVESHFSIKRNVDKTQEIYLRIFGKDSTGR